ncbi:MAG: hypothetical protein R3E12_18940 [Candidatus Eisenbacteria bacterium]
MSRAADWDIVPLGTSEDLLGIERETWTERWVVGRGGFAAHSSANRTVWAAVDVGTVADLLSVFEPGSEQVWVGAGGGTVRYQNVGTWVDRSIPSGENFVLFSRNVGGALAVGDQGSIYRTSDYGQTWQPQASGVSVSLHAGGGFIDGPAWAVGDGGTIVYRSPGQPWTSQVSGTSADLYGFAETPVGNVAVGELGTILRSTDQGTTWIAKGSGTTATLFAVSVAKNDFNVLYAAGAGGVVVKSTDRGETWCRLLTGDTTDFYAIEAVSHLEVFVAGAGGRMLRTINGGGPCTDPADVPEPILSTRFELSAPWPQPSAGTVRFQLIGSTGSFDLAGEIRGQVVDASGRLVLPPLDVERRTGDPIPIVVPGDRLPTGVYFLRVTGGGFTSTRRFLIVR